MPPMCDPKTTRAYCCTKHNWVGASRLWNNRPHSLGLLAYIFAARTNPLEDIFAGRYFREKIFSRKVIFAGRYFRVNSIFAKLSSRENISNSVFAKISSRENNVLYSMRIRGERETFVFIYRFLPGFFYRTTSKRFTNYISNS